MLLLDRHFGFTKYFDNGASIEFGGEEHYVPVSDKKEEIDFKGEEPNAFFANHCDDPMCNLGSFWYECPSCGKYIYDYDIWWIEDAIKEEGSHKFSCKKCESPLIVEYDKGNCEFNVKTLL